MAAGEHLLIQRNLFHLSAELSRTYGKAVLTGSLAGRASLPSRYRPKPVRCSWSGQIRFMQGGDCWRNSGKQENELRAPTIGATSDAWISAPNF